MNTHQGYTSKGNDAQCSKCENWIGPSDSCVLMQPAMVEQGGHARTTATAHHGVLCMKCFKEL